MKSPVDISREVEEREKALALALARVARAQDMYQAYLRGMTLAEVGGLFGISRERVRQIFFWNHLPSRDPGWHPPGSPKRQS